LLSKVKEHSFISEPISILTQKQQFINMNLKSPTLFQC